MQARSRRLLPPGLAMVKPQGWQAGEGVRSMVDEKYAFNVWVGLLTVELPEDTVIEILCMEAPSELTRRVVDGYRNPSPPPPTYVAPPKTHSVYKFARILGVGDGEIRELIKSGVIEAEQHGQWGFTHTNIPESQVSIAALALLERYEKKIKQLSLVSFQLRSLAERQLEERFYED